MVARIRRVWPGETLTVIIVVDDADAREKRCFVWMRGSKGPLIASLCERVENNGHGLSEQRVVLTTKPPTRRGYEIEEAELVPQTETQ